MFRNRLELRLLASIVVLFSPLLRIESAFGETWTDQSGKYQVEAEFVGVEGRSIVLRQPDGSSVKVPIDRLSAASRSRAKHLYETSKSRASAGGTSNSSLHTSQGRRTSNFTPPEPPQVAPLPAFPENASLQATVDFVVTQIQAGHPEVLWHALPEEFREAVDSDEVRMEEIKEQKAKKASNEVMAGVAMKLVEILTTKKQFVLNSPLIAQVPPPAILLIGQGYDPAVGTIYELAMIISASAEDIEHQTVTEILNHRGPRVGGHLKSLLKLPPINAMLSGITVEQTSETTGFISMSNRSDGTGKTEMVKLSGRWVPKDFAEGWEQSKDNLMEVFGAPEQSTQDAEMKQEMAEKVALMANRVLDPMLAAANQNEFDQALMRAIVIGPMIARVIGASDTSTAPSRVQPRRDVESKVPPKNRGPIPAQLQALEKQGAKIYQFNPGQFSVGYKKPTDSGLASLSGMTNITSLGLGDPNEEAELNLTDEGFRHIGTLTALEGLSMYQPASISDAGVEHLRSLNHLKFVTLKSARLSDTSLSYFSGLNRLRILSIGTASGESDFEITDAGLEHLRELTDLTTLSINQASSFTDAGLQNLEHLTKLTLLSLRSPMVTSDGLAHLHRLSNLENLHLTRALITNDGLAHIKRFTKLKSLSLINTKITDSGLANLSGLTDLQSLFLSGTDIGDAGLAHLVTLSKLRMIMAPGTRITAAGAAKLKRSVPRCTIISSAGVF